MGADDVPLSPCVTPFTNGTVELAAMSRVGNSTEGDVVLSLLMSDESSNDRMTGSALTLHTSTSELRIQR